jgi:hypothetical protein
MRVLQLSLPVVQGPGPPPSFRPPTGLRGVTTRRTARADEGGHEPQPDGELLRPTSSVGHVSEHPNPVTNRSGHPFRGLRLDGAELLAQAQGALGTRSVLTVWSVTGPNQLDRLSTDPIYDRQVVIRC